MIQSFVIKNFKNTVWWRYVIERKLLECFAKKNCKRQIKQSLELKTNQGKGDKPCGKQKVYDNSFDGWIAKKDIDI